MAEEVTLPQLGESVTEGIITQWLVEVGDTVEVDQPLVEISTDKVDTEVPSPVAGTVQELRAEVDDTIEVGQVLAVIGEGDGGGAQDTGEDAAEDDEAAGGEAEGEDGPDEEEATEKAAEAAGAPEDTEQAAEEETGERATGESRPQPERAPATPSAGPAGGGGNGQAASSGEGVLTSPLVRKMLREAGIAPDQVEATGQGGRITREDAERAIAEGPQAAPTGDGDRAPSAPAQAPAAPSRPTPARPEPGSTQIDFEGERQKTVELSRIRKAIARGMHESLQTTAQLTAVVEVDMSRVMATRARAKEEFKAREGVSLSPLPIVARAVTMVLPRHPAMNASMDMDAGTATFHRYINLGMAIDTDMGLIVPNIKDAQDLSIAGLARNIQDLADRARNKKLTPDDISGATFTITNTGSRGVMMDTPILNPPEVGILATTLIEKRPVVVQDEFGQDAIAIRQMSYLCLTYDHRMVDGADAARFLGDVKHTLEHTDFGPELGLQA